MSAALAPTDAWAVAEHEPPAEDHANVAAQHAKAASGHAWSAIGAASEAGRARDATQAAHSDVAQRIEAVTAQMGAWHEHLTSIATQAATAVQEAHQAARHALAVAHEMRGVVEMQRDMLTAFQGIAAALAGPRTVTVVRRAADGAIERAVSSASRAEGVEAV